MSMLLKLWVYLFIFSSQCLGRKFLPEVPLQLIFRCKIIVKTERKKGENNISNTHKTLNNKKMHNFLEVRRIWADLIQGKDAIFIVLEF